MNNQQYVQSLGIDAATQHKCLGIMAKYGENHWWEPETDERKFAYYQMLEPVMLVSDFDRFHAAIERLLGRPVCPHEFGVAHDSLCQEAERAYHGQCDSTEKRQASIMAGMQALVQSRPDAVYLLVDSSALDGQKGA